MTQKVIDKFQDDVEQILLEPKVIDKFQDDVEQRLLEPQLYVPIDVQLKTGLNLKRTLPTGIKLRFARRRVYSRNRRYKLQKRQKVCDNFINNPEGSLCYHEITPCKSRRIYDIFTYGKQESSSKKKPHHCFEPKQDGGQGRCDMCYEYFSRSRLNQHRKTCKGRLICKECILCFQKKMYLKRHLQIHAYTFKKQNATIGQVELKSNIDELNYLQLIKTEKYEICIFRQHNGNELVKHAHNMSISRGFISVYIDSSNWFNILQSCYKVVIAFSSKHTKSMLCSKNKELGLTPNIMLGHLQDLMNSECIDLR